MGREARARKERKADIPRGDEAVSRCFLTLQRDGRIRIEGDHEVLRTVLRNTALEFQRRVALRAEADKGRIIIP